MEMEVHTAIEQLVECVLPRFSDDRVVFHVPIDCRLHHYTSSGRGEIAHNVDIHLLFHRPGNYTKVFWHTKFDGFVSLREIPTDGWKLECDHDSCWTSDGISSPLNKVWWELREKFSKRLQDKRLSKNVWFTMGGCHLYEADVVKVASQDPFAREYLVKMGKRVEYGPTKLVETGNETSARFIHAVRGDSSVITKVLDMG